MIPRYDIYPEIEGEDVTKIVHTSSADGDWCRWKDVKKLIAEKDAEIAYLSHLAKSLDDEIQEIKSKNNP